MWSYLKIFACLLVLLLSCKPAKQAAATNTGSAGEKDKVVFLLFKISRDSVKNINVIELINKTETEGSIKEVFADHSNEENYLLINVYDKEKQVKTIALSHPLFQQVEFVKDDRTFGVKTVELKQSEFFIRVLLKGGAGKVVISETLKGRDEKRLTTIKF